MNERDPFAAPHDRTPSPPPRERPSRYMPRPHIKGPFKFGDCPTAWSWENEHYFGILRKYDRGFPIGGGPYIIVSISATDGTARHDWRDFQQMKNWLVGPEWEGLELYPAETRLIDPSNRFYLWCVPKGVIPWGLPTLPGIPDRDVNDAHESHPAAPQRPFPDGGKDWRSDG